jgi:hypothetical protein
MGSQPRCCPARRRWRVEQHGVDEHRSFQGQRGWRYSDGMQSTIIRRIERELGITGLMDALANELPGSDLQSLMLEVYRVRSSRVREPTTLARAARDPLWAPSVISARDLNVFDSVAFAAASDFVALDLSPVCPFGASSVLGRTSQNNVLTAIRNAEALGDSTIAMALEAARRRDIDELVRLCASHRVIRLQPFEVAGFTPHFRLFGLVTAGRETGSSRFETAHLLEHVAVYLRLFRRLNASGFSLQRPMVEFTDMTAVEIAIDAAGISRDEVRSSIRAHHLGGTERFLREHGIALPADAHHPLLESEVIEPLRAEFPEAQYRLNYTRLEGLGYYRRFALRISPQAPDGDRHPVVDGGFTDWTARLMSNQKERLLISGIGSEFVCKKYVA